MWLVAWLTDLCRGEYPPNRNPFQKPGGIAFLVPSAIMQLTTRRTEPALGCRGISSGTSGRTPTRRAPGSIRTAACSHGDRLTRQTKEVTSVQCAKMPIILTPGPINATTACGARSPIPGRVSPVAAKSDGAGGTVSVACSCDLQSCARDLEFSWGQGQSTSANALLSCESNFGDVAEPARTNSYARATVCMYIGRCRAIWRRMLRGGKWLDGRRRMQGSCVGPWRTGHWLPNGCSDHGTKPDAHHTGSNGRSDHGPDPDTQHATVTDPNRGTGYGHYLRTRHRAGWKHLHDSIGTLPGLRRRHYVGDRHVHRPLGPANRAANQPANAVGMHISRRPLPSRNHPR